MKEKYYKLLSKVGEEFSHYDYSLFLKGIEIIYKDYKENTSIYNYYVFQFNEKDFDKVDSLGFNNFEELTDKDKEFLNKISIYNRYNLILKTNTSLFTDIFEFVNNYKKDKDDLEYVFKSLLISSALEDNPIKLLSYSDLLKESNKVLFEKIIKENKYFPEVSSEKRVVDFYTIEGKNFKDKFGRVVRNNSYASINNFYYDNIDGRFYNLEWEDVDESDTDLRINTRHRKVTIKKDPIWNKNDLF